MDSDNSGSLESSSSTGGGLIGEDHIEEYNSPPPPPPSFFTTNNHHQQPTPSSMFDPFTTYFDPSPPLPPPSITQQLFLNNNNNQIITQPLDHLQIAHLPSNHIETNTNNMNKNNNMGTTTAATSTSVRTTKNPKKRTRASRRAPTTVLTTDTNNFRAMVQEFTGIPAQPFTSLMTSAALPLSLRANRFDLFGSIETCSPYSNLLRPFSNKLLNTNNNFNNPCSSSTTTTTTSIYYQQQPPPQLLNQDLNFNTLLESPTLSTKNPFFASANINEFTLKMGNNVLEEELIGLSHNTSISASGLIAGQSPAATSSKTTNNNNNKSSNLASDWSDYGAVGSMNGAAASSVPSLSENINPFGTSSTPRSNEGIVEPWICSSG